MRRLAFAAIAALIALPAIAQWARSHQSDTGTWVCAGPDGAEYDTLYDSAGAATIYCNGMAAAQRFVEAVLGVSVAEAALSLGQLDVCSNGILYAEDPDCSGVGTGTDFAWTGSVPNFQGLTEDTDTIGPYDLSTHCEGDDCGSVTYSLLTVSGTACETGSSQFAISMASLSNDGTESGSGSCRVQMSFDGDTVNGNIWSWDIGAAPGTDEIAPTIPTGITTTGSEGAVTIDWLASTDAGGDGVKDYLVKKDSTTIATVTSGVQSGLQLSYTSTEIGTVSGTPAYDVTGHSHSITCEGGGMATGASTDDSFCGQYATLTGDFTCHFTIDSITPSTGSIFHQGGINIRSSVADAQSAGLFAFGQYDADGNERLLVRSRPVSGNAAINEYNNLLSLRSVLVERIGDEFTVSHSSAGSPNWQTAVPITMALPAEVNVVYWGSDALGTGGSTIQMSQVACNDAPAVSHTDNSGTGGSYTVAARDESDNTSADSVAVTGTPGAPPSGDGVKFNPGVYIWGFTTGSDAIQDRLGEMCATDNVEGVLFLMRWKQLETGSTTAGASYTFDQLQSWYDTLAACGKRTALQIQRNIGGQSNPGPAYLENESQYDGGTVYVSGHNLTQIKGYVPAVMDRLIALETALAAQFDEAANFEAIIFPETAFGSPTPGDYSLASWLNEIKRLLTARVDIWPNTNKIIFANFLNTAGSSTYADLIQHMETTEAVMGGPDIYPQGIGQVGTNPGTVEDRTSMQCHYLGDSSPCSNGSTSGTDYRGRMGYMGSIQPPEMGGRKGNHTPANLHAEADDVLEASHIFIRRKTWQIDGPGSDTSDDEANWNSGGPIAPAGMKSFIEAGSMAPTGSSLTCPENYSAGCL